MQTATNVLFNQEERKTLAQAANAATILFREDQDSLRLLNGVCQKGDAVSRERLERAEDRLTDLLAQVEIERTEEHWLREAGLAATQAAALSDQERAMMRAIIEAREVQAGQVREALQLLAQAKMLAHTPEYDEELVAT